MGSPLLTLKVTKGPEREKRRLWGLGAKISFNCPLKKGTFSFSGFKYTLIMRPERVDVPFFNGQSRGSGRGPSMKRIDAMGHGFLT
jgi:hypothetical protein